MFKRFKHYRRLSLGIDIGVHHINGIEISHFSEAYQIEAVGIEPLPQGLIQGHVIQNINELSGHLKNLLKSASFQSKNAVIALPDSAVISQIISIPANLNEAEIKEFILLERENHIPFPIEEINLDFTSLENKNSWTQQVLLVATRTSYIDSRLEACKQAGLKVIKVDVESFAIERVLRLLSPISGENRLAALFNIQKTQINLFVFDKNGLLFTYEEAFDNSALCTKEKAEGAEAIIQAIFLQIRRFLQLFFSTFNDHKTIDRLFLAGEVYGLSQLIKLVEEKLGVASMVLNFLSSPAVKNTTTLLENGAYNPFALVTAFGLALGKGKVT